MSIGDQIFQLATGIIQNERQRKRNELEAVQLKDQRKQAEATLSMRAQEVEARQGFLKVQQDQLAARLSEPPDPLEIEMKKARIGLLQAQTTAALRTKDGQLKPEKVSITDQKSMLSMRQAIDTRARDNRANVVLQELNEAEDPSLVALPAGLDAVAIQDGLQVAGVATVEGMRAKLSANQRQADALSRGGLAEMNAAELSRINADISALTLGINEVEKLRTPTPSIQEFLQTSTGLLPQDFATQLYMGTRSPLELQHDVWGGPINQGQFDVAISELNGGQPLTMIKFIQQNPGIILDNRGQFTPDGGSILSQLLVGNGVSTENTRAIIGLMARTQGNTQ
jgi:hypothetical protein